jgi:glucose/arabinose dehydrogenase
MRTSRWLTIGALAAGCGDNRLAEPDAYLPTCEVVAGRPALGLEEVASGLDMPVFVTAPPADPRLFILEKTGAIRIVEDGMLLPEPFLELGVTALDGLDDSHGLFALAFHPDFHANRRVFVYYTDPSTDLVVEQYLVSEDNPNVADPASATRVLFVDAFGGSHNGGTIQFGPDGYLYLALGDSGGSNDPRNYGQDLEVLHGKMLRIDVDELPYTIPPDNPFAGATPGLDEIWAYGLRNPWRWSFDRATGDLYLSDVGQGAWEEWNVQPASSPGGVNYGWSDREGAHCFDPVTECATEGRTDPVHEVSQDTGACAAIGGYVYRGCRMPGYQGTYFFADYCAAWVHSFEWTQAGGAGPVTDWPSLGGGDIVSFGEDASGELYVVRQGLGQVLRIVPVE